MLVNIVRFMGIKTNLNMEENTTTERLRDLPFASTEEGIVNVDLAALRELNVNGTVTIQSMPIDSSGKLPHITVVEITN